MQNEPTVWVVFLAAMMTAIFTGFGALPFVFFKDISDRVLGIANSTAAGLMLGASIGLIIEGAQLQNIDMNIIRLIAGLVIGFVLISLVQSRLSVDEKELHVGAMQGVDARKMLLIVGVMTAHSFAEGIGVGVSYGDGNQFGALISLAIAVHNIPEGLAISLVLIPRGTSIWRAAGWSIFSSLPQPLMAIPAFLFVLLFRPFLPVGLGLAAGAMIWMVFYELMPEAREDVSNGIAYTTMAAAVVVMLAFQALIGG